MKTILGLLIGMGLYSFITIPHLIYVFSNHEYGINYHSAVLNICGLLSGFVGYILITIYSNNLQK